MLPPKIAARAASPSEIPWLVAAYAVTAVGYIVLFMALADLFSFDDALRLQLNR